MSISSANNVQYSEILSNHEVPNSSVSHVQSNLERLILPTNHVKLPELSSNLERLILPANHIQSPDLSSNLERLILPANHVKLPELSSNMEMPISSPNNLQYSEILPNHEVPDPSASHMQSSDLSSNLERLILLANHVKLPELSSNMEMPISSPNNLQHSEILSTHEVPDPSASHVQSLEFSSNHEMPNPSISSNQEFLISSAKYVKFEELSSTQEILGLCPNYAQSHEEVSSNRNTPDSQFPEVSSNKDNEDMLDSIANREQVSFIDIGFEDGDDSVNLAKRLSDALANLHSKEDMVKQHSLVAGEAIAGWERAEMEVLTLKQEVESANLKNIILEGKVDYLSNALKECARKVRQARDEEKENFNATVIEKTRIWEFEKLEFKSRIAELESLLEFTQAEASTLKNHNLESKHEVVMRENAGLKLKLCSLSEEIRVHVLEKELGILAMEKASKQYLENIKKISKLEAECRRLRVPSQKISSHFNDQRSIGNSTYVESLTDSHSDSGERSSSDMWALSLTTEFDQFKTLKNVDEITHVSFTELDLMDDFLEMERLAALDMVQGSNPCFDFGVVSNQATETERISLNEDDDAFQRTLVLEKTVERLEKEKTELDIILTISQAKLKESQNMLLDLDLERQLDYSKKDLELKLKLNVIEDVSMAMPSQFKITRSEAQVHDKFEISDNDDTNVTKMDGL